MQSLSGAWGAQQAPDAPPQASPTCAALTLLPADSSTCVKQDEELQISTLAAVRLQGACSVRRSGAGAA